KYSRAAGEVPQRGVHAKKAAPTAAAPVELGCPCTVGLCVPKAPKLLPAPSSATTTLISPGAALPFFRPMTRCTVWLVAGAELSLAGLPRISTCTASAPVVLGPVQVIALPSRPSTTLLAGATVTHRSIWLVAPPLLGAPVT